MAEFTDQDRELLNKLRKAFERTAKTTLARTPWQEHISRDESVNANRAALAAKIIEGFAGSWAAQYQYGWGGNVLPALLTPDRPLATPDPIGPPVPIRAKSSKIGRRGLPEINFVPYNWRTNTLGSKGPSLVGHPISFEVVGPTLKSPFTDWTWKIIQGAGPNGGDLLIPDVRPDGVLSPFMGPINDMYGPGVGTLPWTIGDAAEPNGGLYVVVVDDGADAGALDTGGGQIPMAPLPNFMETARYEIFRVSMVEGATIEIHPNKGFGGFFDLPALGTRYVRAIMIVRPHVTRLAAIPQSGAAGGSDGISTYGREQTFVVVSPERAATSDLFPPYVGGAGPGSGDGSWLGGGFTEARAPGSGTAPGDPAAYGGAFRLPVPIPLGETVGAVERGILTLPSVPTGTWKVMTPNTPFWQPQFANALPIVRVSSTSRDDILPDFSLGTIENAFGWFDVLELSGVNGPEWVQLGRVPEADPQTGLIYFGPGPYIQNVTALDVTVGMTLHQPISQLWLESFDLDKVEASRIRNLIDPSWVERSDKQISDPSVSPVAPPPLGSGAGRADKAIFETQTSPGLPGPLPEAANPGNMMDLGFRMVVFPAKEDAVSGDAVPDFDRPIPTREVLIDGSVTDEEQFVELDYPSGVVRLSVPPPTSQGGAPSQPSDVIPNGIVGTATNNQRGEVVLFAAVVPYSMEDSQVGTGTRLTSHEGTQRDYDVSSAEVRAQIDQGNTVFAPGAAPFFGVSGLTGAVSIVLDRVWDGPETGIVTITSGRDDSPSFGNWGYTSTSSQTVGFRPVTALEGLSSQPTALDPTVLVSGEPRSVVLRREVDLFKRSLTLPAVTDFYFSDTAFGSSIRAETVRFKDSLTRYNMDGSVTVESRSPGYTWHQMGQWAASGIEDPVSGDDRISDTGLLAGVFYQEGQPIQTRVPSFATSVPFLFAAGQLASFASGGGASDFRGIVTRKSQILLSNQFRLVVKFYLLPEAADNFSAYVGLIGPASLGAFPAPPPVSLVLNAVAPLPNAGFSYLGVKVDGTAATGSLDFFAQDRGIGPPGLLISSGVDMSYFTTPGNDALYLVIETELFRDTGIVGDVGNFVKMALFDTEFRELGSTRFYNQDSVPRPVSGPLELVVGVRNPDGVGQQLFGLYYAQLVNQIQLPFAVIP